MPASLNLICKMVGGSRLHGTALPESDTDLKAVYLPSLTECVLGSAQHNIQVPSENLEIFSLQEFLRLAAEGQTMAIEMLHTPPEFIVSSSPLWENIRLARRFFHTRNMNAFVGYAKSMMTKYVTRGSRLTIATQVRDAVRAAQARLGDHARLRDIVSTLPTDAHARRTSIVPRGMADEVWGYEICGRFVADTTPLKQVMGTVDAIVRQFGSRVQAVADGDGTERKSLAHAFRVAYELRHILRTGDLTFPLEERAFLLAVKTGAEPVDASGDKLTALMDELETLNARSGLPEAVDPELLRSIVLDAYSLRVVPV